MVKNSETSEVSCECSDDFHMLCYAKSLQLCPTLCDPIDGSPPGSPVPGILRARTLEWVAISVSNAWKWKVKVKSLSCVWLSVTPWTAAYQAPPSMGFSRQEYWSGVPLPSLQWTYSHSLSFKRQDCYGEWRIQLQNFTITAKLEEWGWVSGAGK